MQSPSSEITSVDVKKIAVDILSNIIVKLNASGSIQGKLVQQTLVAILNHADDQSVKNSLVAGYDLYQKYGELISAWKQPIRKSVFE